MKNGRDLSAISTLLALVLASTAWGATAEVRIKGSDTIGGALGPDLAEQYHQENPDTGIVWEALGSGTAFVGLFDGSADLGASSRPIGETELAEAARQKLQLKEWVIGYDGVAIIVHPGNTVPQLTLQQASNLFQGRIKNWRELGGPDRAVRLIGRPTYSGTHSFFRDKVLRKGNAKGPEEFAATVEVVESNPDILRLVAQDPGAASYVGQGWVKSGVRAVPLAPAPGQPALLPTPDTVRTGRYPAFRALYVYTRGEPQGEARNLLAFIQSPAGQELVSRNGFVPNDAPSRLAYAAHPRVVAQPADAATAPTVLASAARRADPAAASAPATPTLIRVFFPAGGARLTDEAELKLAQAAALLARGSRHALVVGHADASGPQAVNRALAKARAVAVFAALSKATPRAAIAVDAKGSEEPVASNETAAGRRDNRRVDILIIDGAAPAGSESRQLTPH